MVLSSLPALADDSPVILLCAVALARDGQFVPRLVIEELLPTRDEAAEALSVTSYVVRLLLTRHEHIDDAVAVQAQRYRFIPQNHLVAVRESRVSHLAADAAIIASKKFYYVFYVTHN